LQALLFLTAIWLFALLTGLSPSVNRASAMITFVIIGKASGKKPSTYNSVAASAFILLLIDPQSLFNVGFQLSFLAVVAILFFQPRVYRLFEPKSWLMEKIWSLTSVSIAAQIGTTALSIYYFQQFPVYAFVSNLFVIPGAFLVMVMAIALLAFSFIYPMAKLIALILSSVITGLNTVTKFIDSLPGSCIESISLSGSELILLYLGLTIMMNWLVSKQSKLIPAMLLVAILAFAFRDYRFIRQGSTKTFTVYHVRGKTAFSVAENRHLWLYADSNLLSDRKSIKYLLGNSMTNHFITNYTVGRPGMPGQKNNPEFSDHLLNGLVLVDTLKVLHLNSDYVNFSTDKKLKLHYILLSDKVSVNLQVLDQLFEYELLIADASVPDWKLDLIKGDCRQMEIPFYSVSESGAFVHTVRR
jgi:competence protein ComEC